MEQFDGKGALLAPEQENMPTKKPYDPLIVALVAINIIIKKKLAKKQIYANKQEYNGNT